MRIVHSAIAAIAVSLAFSACAGGSGASSFYPAGPESNYLPAGSMSVKVEAEAPFDFERAQYNVVFNTSGVATTPDGGMQASNWKGLSYALIAGGDGKATAGPVAFVRGTRAVSAPAILALRATPKQFTFNPNSNGLGTEYEITFARRIFGGTSLPAVKTPWTFNLFVSEPNLRDARFHFISGMSCAHCFASPQLDVTKRFDVVRYVTVGPTSGDPATHIVRVEIVNNP